jgi:serine/threonine protein kinase
MNVKTKRDARISPSNDNAQSARPVRRLSAESVSVPGHYGLSYKGILGPGDADLRITSNVPDAREPLEPKRLFIKCPDPADKSDVQEDFLREFDSGQAINIASANLAKHPRTPRFEIPQMLGQGTLRLSSQGDAEASDCLIYEYAQGEMLHTLSFPPTVQHGLDLSEKVLNFAVGLSRAVQVLHNQGVVHSFLVPRNILCGNVANPFAFTGTFSVVGFGYARLCDAQGKVPPSLKISAQDNCFRAPETRKQETYKAYWLPADVYSIGALLYYLLLRMDGRSDQAARKEFERLPIDVPRLKAKIANDLIKTVPETIRTNENILKIIDSCLRHDQEQRFSCVEELLDALEIAKTAGRRMRWVGKPNISRTEAAVAKKVKLIVIDDGQATSKSSYFKHLRSTLANHLASNYGSLHRGHLEVYGSREQIVPSLCRLLGSAERHDRYDTVTLPDYWTDENLGSMGRFLTMNKHMVRKGVHIRRVFLVSKPFDELSEVEQVILEAQLAAWRDIERERVNLKRGEKPYGNFEIYVAGDQDEDKIAEFENVGSTVAYLGRPTKQVHEGEKKHSDDAALVLSETVCLNFFSTARARWSKGKILVTRSIKKVRYWVPIGTAAQSRFEENVSNFKKYVADAKSIETYVRGGLGEPEDLEIATLLKSACAPPDNRVGDEWPTH